MTTELLGSRPHGAHADDVAGYGIVAFSHLRWSFVWQRPQQFLSRFAEWHPVLFVEEPVWDLEDGQEPTIQIERVGDNIHFAIPHLPAGVRTEECHDELRRLTQQAIDWVNVSRAFDKPMLWYYSPMMAEWSLGHFNERGVVYDCMDELSQFRGAPEGLVRNEASLLDRSDVVFTGGYELFEKKSRQHDNVHCFGCGVEYDHFAQAQDTTKKLPEDVAGLQRPIIGWFGVIDERVDYDLLREAARLKPEASFVMVGPVVKVDPETLPKEPNIHWLGGRDYKELPDYCRAFDICIMCFALNEATEFINPTKALEYLATGKPVISTPVRDVVRQYQDSITIVDSPAAFVAAIDRLQANPDLRRIELGNDRARSCSWEGTVSQMRDIIERAIGARAAAVGAASVM